MNRKTVATIATTAALGSLGFAASAQAYFAQQGPVLPLGETKGLPLTNALVTDFNLDSRVDLTVGNQFANQITRFANTGTGFAAAQTRLLPPDANQDFEQLASFNFANGGNVQQGAVVGTRTGLHSVLHAGSGLLPGPVAPLITTASHAIASSSEPFVPDFLIRAAPGQATVLGATTGLAFTVPKTVLVPTLARPVAADLSTQGHTAVIADAGIPTNPQKVFVVRQAAGAKPTATQIFGRPSAIDMTPLAGAANPLVAVTEQYAGGDGAVAIHGINFTDLSLKRYEPILLPVAPTDVRWADVDGDKDLDLVIQAGGTYVYLQDKNGFNPVPGGPYRTPGDTVAGTKVVAANLSGNGPLELVVASSGALGPASGGLTQLAATRPLTGLLCGVIGTLKRGATATAGDRKLQLTGTAGGAQTGVIPCDSTVKPGKGEVVLIASGGAVKDTTPRERNRATLKGTGTFKLSSRITRARRYMEIKLVGKKGRCRGTRGRAAVTGSGRFIIKGRRASVAFNTSRATMSVTDSCSGKTRVAVSRGKLSVKPLGRKVVTLGKGRTLTR